MSNAPVIYPDSHVIVIGNEKGGAGKTTTTMHVIASLLHLGFSVGSIDLDSRQLSLSRYIENRRKMAEKYAYDIAIPLHTVVKRSELNNKDEAEQDERHRLLKCLSALSQRSDFLVVDTPGSDNFLSREVHSWADTIITPINDSFVDLDVIGQFNADTLEVERPGIYGEMVWQQKLRKAKRSRGEIDWIVLRNRLSNIDARNKRNVADALHKLARRIGFRQIDGFGERVIYRELFLHGLTLLDIMDMPNSPITPSLSHVAAKQELRSLLVALNIPKLSNQLLKHNLSGKKSSPPSSTSTSKETSVKQGAVA